MSTVGNFFTKALSAAGFSPVLNRMRTMVHPGTPLFLDRLLRRTRFDYRREVGDGLDSSVVTAPIMWIQRALPEAVLAIEATTSDGTKEDMEEHEMLALIQRPNDFYGDIALWMATILSFLIDGNAYWLKVRNAAGKVVELWWVPWWMIEPKSPIDGSTFIQYYEYTPGTAMGRTSIDPADVVHFRHGIHPRNHMKGLSPIDGVIREIFTDLEASNFVASLLRNMGVPGVIISPKSGAMPTPDDVEATKAWFKAAFGGDNRGGPLVMGAPTDVSSYGFDPKAMDLSEGRDVAEERICACLGVPAAIVGFGSGLQQTKVGATMEELRRLAWQNGVLPYARMLADEMQRSLLPDFQRGRSAGRGAGFQLKVYWNTENVVALQEDEDKRIERKLKEFQAGAITLFDYLSETGREAEDSHRYYLRPFSVIEVPLAIAGRGVQPAEPEAQSEPAPEAAQAKALPTPETKNSEDWLPAGARPASPAAIERGERFVLLLQRQETALRTGFEQALRPLFEELGDAAGRAAADTLRARGEKALVTKEGPAIETKADEDIIRQVIALLNLEGWAEQLSANYQKQYLAIARAVEAGITESGFAFSIPDARMREVIATGGKRAGLIDLDTQTRKAVFDALAEGRAAGEGVEALANRIANNVEGGIWGDAQTRARVIARTETKYAQNVSTIEAARANGAAQMVVFDGRFGEPRSEASHIARDGMIVSAEEAQIMTDNMRPNCTLSFAPHFNLGE